VCCIVVQYTLKHTADDIFPIFMISINPYIRCTFMFPPSLFLTSFLPIHSPIPSPPIHSHFLHPYPSPPLGHLRGTPRHIRPPQRLHEASQIRPIRAKRPAPPKEILRYRISIFGIIGYTYHFILRRLNCILIATSSFSSPSPFSIYFSGGECLLLWTPSNIQEA
jgi:hypothetical protein